MSETTSATFLERIVAATRAHLSERMRETPLDVMRERALAAPPSRPFAAALRPIPGGPARLIAEVKRASPSKGLLAERFDPVARARAYAAGGAAAISVLTEPDFFLGSLDDLRAVRAAVDAPVLRKDFLLDPYQVYEARAAGADAVLLICALLDDAALGDLLALARALGMDALVEAHDADEAQRAVAAGAGVIGVNSRNLRTFAVDPDVVRQLRPLVPANRVFVAESGIGDALGAARARAFGADAILVGEALMRSEITGGIGARPVERSRRGDGPILRRGITSLRQDLRPEDGGACARCRRIRRRRLRVSLRAQPPPGHPKPSTNIGRSRAFGSAPASIAGEGEQGRGPRPSASSSTSQPSASPRLPRSVGLDAVQLSGDESPEYMRWLAEADRTACTVARCVCALR